MGRIIRPFKATQVDILNPLPGGVTQEDVVRAAGFFDPKASQEPAFKVDYKWQGAGIGTDGSFEYDELTLNPGEAEKLDEKVVDIILKTVGHLGIVKVKEGDDIRKKTVEGLNKAKNHYNLHGSVGYLKFQDRAQYSEEQMNRNKNIMKPYLINMEKEKLIQAEIEKLEKEYLAERPRKTSRQDFTSANQE